MKVRRDIASIPKRSAAQTWQAIIDLITGDDSVDVATLKSASSVMESLIADEHPSSVPITLRGVGSRLVIYCKFGEDAMDAELEVPKLNWNPTAGNWAMTAPTELADVGWMNITLKERAPRISVHDVKQPSETDNEKSEDSTTFKINWGALGKP